MLTLALLLELGLGLAAQVAPATTPWRAIASTGAARARSHGSVIWTGREVVVWGGCDEHADHYTYRADGAVYDPAADAWRPLPAAAAPGPRAWHTAVWSGREVLIWGGHGEAGDLGDGCGYDPSGDRWRALSATGAPAARGSHVAVWTGAAMLVWAGVTEERAFSSGGLYDPAADAWRPIHIDPGERVPRTLPGVWAGDRFLAWGGINGGAVLDTGVWFRPAGAGSGRLSEDGAPSRRALHTALWTGGEMVVWGGSAHLDGGAPLGDGARYEPARDSWTPMDDRAGPGARFAHAAVWSGDDMLVLGGATAVAGDALRDVWAWRPDAGWRPLPELPEPRAEATACLTPQGVVLIGGRDATKPRAGGFVLPRW